MKNYFKLIAGALLMLLFYEAKSQQKQCNCLTEPSMNTSISNCRTINLRNGGKLYYQFNCDSVWLTLDKPNKARIVIYSLAGSDFKELFNYNYRIGYQLSKEYNRYLLFRTACPANGPCNFVLVDKISGKKVKHFGELIYDHTDDGGRFYNFVIYFSNPNLRNQLTIYYIDANKKYYINISPEHFSALVPEYEFEKIYVSDNKLILTYHTLKGDQAVTNKIQFDLKGKPRI